MPVFIAARWLKCELVPELGDMVIARLLVSVGCGENGFDAKVNGRLTSLKLSELVKRVMKKPLVSAEMVAKTLELTPQAARRIVSELGLREMTGRGRFRAWSII